MSTHDRIPEGVANEVQRYSMLIRWSDDDRAFAVHLPEWEQAGAVVDAVARGVTIAEAATNGEQALVSLITSWRGLGWELPGLAPAAYQAVGEFLIPIGGTVADGDVPGEDY